MAFKDNLKPVAGYLYRDDDVALNSLQQLAIYAFDADGTVYGPGVAIDADPGSNLVVNGTFDADTDWTKGSGWAIAAGVATKTPPGTAALAQDFGIVAGNIYKVVFTTSGRTAGSVTMDIGGTTGTARSTNATFTEYLKATNTNAFRFVPDTNFDGSIDVVTAQIVGITGADRVNMWVGDRVAAGVAQAGDAGLFIRSEDGTLSFFGDQWILGAGDDVAFSLPAADTLGIATGGTERLRVDGTGFGIDVTPSYKLHIKADGAITTFQAVSGATPAIYLRFSGSTDTRFGYFGYGGSGGTMELYNDLNAPLLFSTNGLTRVTIPAAGGLLINGATVYADNGQLLEVNKSADDGGIGLFCWSTTDAERALIEFHKSSSATIGTKALVADEEAAGGIIWKVADGAVNWSPIASIEGYVDTAPGAGDTGGRLVLGTTADGAATVTEALRIDSAQEVRALAGNVKIANATDGGTAGLHIRSKRAVSAAMSGATVNIATQIPSGAIILGAQFNVDTLIGGATTWSAAFNTGSTTSLGSGYALAQNTKVNFLVAPEKASAATDITLTAAGSNFTAGVIEAIVYYIDQTSMANA